MVALFVLFFILTCVLVDYVAHRKQYQKALATPSDVMYHPVVGLSMADGGQAVRYTVAREGDTVVIFEMNHGERTPIGCFANHLSDEDIGKMVRALNK